MLKTAIVQSRLGAAAFALRGRLLLHRAVGRDLEGIGAIASDAIARVLTERLCRDGRDVIDVGAHIGSVVNGVRRHARPGRIFAVEAMPDKAERLRSAFPDVTVITGAAADRTGTATFFVDELRPGFSSLNAGFVEGSRTREITVAMVRLDDVVDSDAVDLVKIIVEGAELGVLRGAERITERCRPTFIFESGSEEVGGYTHEALWSWFAERGYAVLMPNRVAHDDDGMTLEVFRDAHLYPRRTTLYVGVAKERRAEIRDCARSVLAGISR